MIPANSGGMRWSLPLVVLFVFACSDSEAPVPPGEMPRTIGIGFAAEFRGQPVECGKPLEEVGLGGHQAELQDFRFFISDPKLVSTSGEVVPMTLIPDGLFQSDRVALIDFEDQTVGCKGMTNTKPVNTRILGVVPPGEYDGLVFDVGVPVDINHFDPKNDRPPLNATGMGWPWEIGHKFLKLELAVKEKNGFLLHVGSFDCHIPEGSTPAATECERPNRATIRLSGIDFKTERVVFDLESFLADTDVSTANCQSFPDGAPACNPLFARLGVDFATGGCVSDCSAQSVFTVRQ